ncbi:MAG: type I 3-dehydroquinate dehydratase [Candidatus Omnitrophica bacterium]|nr:type I 3-dehydroquinate dehydratase [Candidatus Omnitrophota bacterium]
MNPILLGPIDLRQKPRVAGVVDDTVVPETLQTLHEQGVDVLELRVDTFGRFEPEYCAEVAKKYALSGMPLLATVRSPAEGGEGGLQPGQRLTLYRALAPYVHAVDVELGSQEILPGVLGLAREHGLLPILSYHNFEQTPDSAELTQIVGQCVAAGAVAKIATMAQSREDALRLAMITLEHCEQGLVTLAMGAPGQFSRVLFPFLGSLLTYGYAARPTAPGQPSAVNLAGAIRSLC